MSRNSKLRADPRYLTMIFLEEVDRQQAFREGLRRQQQEKDHIQLEDRDYIHRLQTYKTTSDTQTLTLMTINQCIMQRAGSTMIPQDYGGVSPKRTTGTAY